MKLQRSLHLLDRIDAMRCINALNECNIEKQCIATSMQWRESQMLLI